MLDNVYGVLGFQYLQLLEGHYHLECMQSLSNISNTNNISDLYFSFKVIQDTYIECGCCRQSFPAHFGKMSLKVKICTTTLGLYT